MADDTKPLAGKVALVTGSVRRIGRATALAAARDGAAVVIHARDSRDEADATAAEVKALGVDSLVCLADVTDEAAVRAMVARIRERFGRLDVLVNNAGIRAQVPFAEMTLAQWRAMLTVILDGAFIVTSACLPLMRASGQGGVIVNIGGGSAHVGALHRAHVVTAKAGLVGFTRALATELAEDGITVNCVAPGRIGGQRSKTAGAAPPDHGGAKELAKREGRPEDVAAMIRPLWLPTGSYITGQTIHVDGGRYLSS
ncbi:MAG TPA: SDR family NAD(P)-dependent oxidoreductase [Candidatus Sulfotelmatobacter sp.]|nr:SDR family NAD(P)-dependent oxidoreductase [Candidatus Sulfotelmatobacter sp.]